jgi:phospholipid transport system substrate-binding protein
MIKKLSIIITIFSLATPVAYSNVLSVDEFKNSTDESVIEIIDPPGIAALRIMVESLASLKELKRQNESSIENIITLINYKFLPFLAVNTATELALKDHWKGLEPQNRNIFQKYIVQSLINDYASILSTYNDLETIHIAIDPEVRRKDNKAIVKLNISFNDDPDVVLVSLKMIRVGRWRVYDVVYSGVSLVMNYRSQFDSHIRRKGLESLITKISSKIK